MRIVMFAGLLAMCLAVPAAAQTSPAIRAAKAAGQVGERYDGYLGFATPPSPALRREVGAINIRRRALYTNLARRRGVTPETAALATACELLTRVPVSQVYLLQDRIWRRRAPGQRLSPPSYCG